MAFINGSVSLKKLTLSRNSSLECYNARTVEVKHEYGVVAKKSLPPRPHQKKKKKKKKKHVIHKVPADKTTASGIKKMGDKERAS